MPRPAGWKLKATLAFAAVYIVWGSTYLAMRIGVQYIPPALLSGIRFIAAGVLITVYALVAGQSLPRGWREWRIVAVAAVLLLVGGNFFTVWGLQWIPSNQAALIVACAALWLAALGTLGVHGEPLSRQALIGLVVGLLGVAVLLRPPAEFSLTALWGQLAVLAGSFMWASGSIYAKRTRPKTPPLMSAGLQSLIGGGVLTAGGLVFGENGGWHASWEGVAVLTYLIVFGSLAYVSYVWLVHEVKPAALGTYAYVNPAIAVVLGWWLLDERLDAAQLFGMATILLGVILVSTAHTEEIVQPEARS